ncbi:MAG TPA: condensation domain-containing protein, partial [Ktedonobacteraceae bacterium]|nr:condensation domain-containing protein [Ktedonobacteraceae bacterium]
MSNSSKKRIANLSPEKLALLMQKLDKVGKDTLRPGIKPRVQKDALCPLSFAQQRLWFLEQLEPGKDTYTIANIIRLDGHLMLEALERSFQEIVDRHETLRTIFVNDQGQAWQRVLPRRPVILPTVDLEQHPVTEREEWVKQVMRQEAQRPFDLERDPLLRVLLLRLGDEEHVMLLSMHHIISDAWSIGVMAREFSLLYAAFADGQASPLKDLAVQYADYVHWQREWLQGEALERQIDYWKHQLGDSVALELPTDCPRPAVQTYHGSQETFQLPRFVTDGLKALSRKEGVTLFMTLLAAFQVLLARSSNQEEVAVGTPIANRTQEELEGLIGFFVNTLVLRTDLSGNPSFRELLKRVKETTLGAYAHQDLPFEQLVGILQPERDLSRSPLFQVMFVFQNIALEGLQLPELALRPMAIENTTAKFDLTLTMMEVEQDLIGTLEYNTDLFKGETIRHLLTRFQHLLEGIVAHPDRLLALLPLYTQEEMWQMVQKLNKAPVRERSEESIQQLIEAQVRRTPDAVAVWQAGEQISYADLNRRANQLARFLQRCGVGPEVPVALCLERRIDLLIGLLGILKAGGVYVPLDPAYPQERIAFALADAQVPVILTQEWLRTRLGEQTCQVICLEQEHGRLVQEAEEDLETAVTRENLAYVIYTSGSTGWPKGVGLVHRGAIELMGWAGQRFGPQRLARVLAGTSICFDLSVFEVFATLGWGGTVVLVENIL